MHEIDCEQEKQNAQDQFIDLAKPFMHLQINQF